jgi:hypothetical protein
MNLKLIKNKPSDTSAEEYKKLWENAGYTLEPLYKVLVDLKEEVNSITKDDFDCPNHYAKLAYNMGQVKVIDYIISILPKSAKM